MVKPYRLVCGCHFVTTSFYIMEVSQCCHSQLPTHADSQASSALFITAIITAMFTLAKPPLPFKIFFGVAVAVFAAVLYALLTYVYVRIPDRL